MKERIFGNGRFLVQGLRSVRGEMALEVVGHNFMRVSNVLGIPVLMSKRVQA